MELARLLDKIITQDKFITKDKIIIQDKIIIHGSHYLNHNKNKSYNNLYKYFQLLKENINKNLTPISLAHLLHPHSKMIKYLIRHILI